MKIIIPSEEERIIIYEKLLNYFKVRQLNDNYAGGFCKALNKIKYRYRATSSVSYSQKVKDFPELMKFKPNSYYSHWFDSNDIQIRIDILKKILKEMIK